MAMRDLLLLEQTNPKFLAELCSINLAFINIKYSI